MMQSIAESRSFRSVVLLAAVALVSACGGDLVDANAQPGTPGEVLLPTQPAAPSVALAFSAEVPAGAVEALSQAAISDTATLYVVADWKNVAAGAVERLDLYLPNGTLYATLELPVAETDRGDLSFQILPDGTRRLTFSLYVWGSPIESQRLTGTWSATASLADGTATASASVAVR